MPTGDPFRKVRTGEKLRIPAAAYNAFIDAAQRARGQDTTSQDTPTFRQSGIILVKNNSGSDRERFDVLGVGDPIFLPAENEDSFKNRVMFDGVMPVDPDHKGKFVILLEPLKAGAIGTACIDGVCPAWVTRPTDGKPHKFANISGGDATSLLIGDDAEDGAAQILWLDPTIPAGGSGWAVVRLLAWRPLDSLVLVRVDGQADCGGCYVGTIMTGKPSVDPSGATEAMPYGLTAGDSCYIINTDENGQDTHLLLVDGTAYTIGWWSGMTTGTNVPVVFVESTIGVRSSPTTIDGTENNYNPDPVSWSRAHITAGDAKGGVPFLLKNTGRIVKKTPATPDGTVDIRGLTRGLHIDATGRWWQVSAETDASIFKLPDFDLEAGCAQVSHTAHDYLWAYSSTAGKWVKLCRNEADFVTRVWWDASNGKLKYDTRTVYGWFEVSPFVQTADIGDYEDCP